MSITRVSLRKLAKKKGATYASVNHKIMKFNPRFLKVVDLQH